MNSFTITFTFRQVEIDSGVSADEAWDTAVDRCQWSWSREADDDDDDDPFYL